MLRVLPKSKWVVKVTATREAKDLVGITLDELLGNLKTYEMHIDKAKREKASPEKFLALRLMKVMTEEQMAFITNNFNRVFKKKNGTSRKKRSNNNPT